jgi:hypothetical protein
MDEMLSRIPLIVLTPERPYLSLACGALGPAQSEASFEASQIAERHEQEKGVPPETAGLRLPSVRMPPARMGQKYRFGSSGRTRLRHTNRQDAA